MPGVKSGRVRGDTSIAVHVRGEVNSGRVRGDTTIADHARDEQWSRTW